MFAYWKGRILPGQVIQEMVTTLDFTATTLAVAGGMIPAEFDGSNLLPRLTGEVSAIKRRQPMYWDFYSGQAIRMGDWKLWRDASTTVLFNIAQDPAELVNLAWQQPERTKQLTKTLDDWSDSLLPSARYDPEGRGKSMTHAFAGAPAGAKPDPRYLIPYDNPVATPYPATVASPGAPKPDTWQTEAPTPQRASGSRASEPNWQDRFFKSRDRNRDGAITLDEFIGNPEGRNVSALTTRFRKFDANNDDKLQLEELKKQKK